MEKQPAGKVEAGPEKPKASGEHKDPAPAKDKAADPGPKGGQQEDGWPENDKPVDGREDVKGQQTQEKEKPKESKQIAEQKPPAQPAGPQ